MNCKRCQTVHAVKAGFTNGHQRYHCKECKYYFTDTPGPGVPVPVKLLGLQLYASGLSLRRIGKLLSVSQVAVMKWIKKLVPELCPKLKPEGRVIVMELDEMWHYLHSKKTNVGSGKLIVSIPVACLTGTVGLVMEPPLKDC